MALSSASNHSFHVTSLRGSGVCSYLISLLFRGWTTNCPNRSLRRLITKGDTRREESVIWERSGDAVADIVAVSSGKSKTQLA